MKKVFLQILGVATLQMVFAGSVFSGEAEAPPPDPIPVDGPVTLCHVPPGNSAKAKTITVDASSVEDHLGHGDMLDECS